MLLSCLLPLAKVTVEQASLVNAQVMSMEDLLLMYQWNSEAVVVEEGSRPFHWQEGLVLVYFGLFFVIVRHLWSLGRMLYLIRHSRCEKVGQWYPFGSTVTTGSFQLDALHRDFGNRPEGKPDITFWCTKWPTSITVTHGTCC